MSLAVLNSDLKRLCLASASASASDLPLTCFTRRDGGSKRPRSDSDLGAEGAVNECDDEQTVVLAAGPPKNIVDVVTPLWAMPYEEQLAMKESSMRKQCVYKVWHAHLHI